MAIINIKNVHCVDDVEIIKNVFFREDVWRIQLSKAEHLTFRFDDFLDSKGGCASQYPDIKLFTKIIVYYSFPESPVADIRSWYTTHQYYLAAVNLAAEFFYAQGLITREAIGSVTDVQLRAFMEKSARIHEHSAKHRRIIVQTPYILKIWIKLTEMDALPDWCNAKFNMAYIISKNVEAALKTLSDIHESGERAWQPLKPHQIKTTYDHSCLYINDFSDAIIEASNLIRQRPRGADGTSFKQVRSDGMTKNLFNKLKNFESPLFPGTPNRLFDFTPKVNMVRSGGYKSGWQERTTIDISSIRTEAIYLKRACIFIISLLTGMRRSEIAHLKSGALSIRDNLSYLRITRLKTSSDPKTGTPDTIPIPPIVRRAIEVLEELLLSARQTLNSEYLILADIVTSKQLGQVKRDTVSRDISAWIRHCSAEHGHAHQLRKTIAWLLISKSEENIDLIRQLFGHKNYRMTLRYVMRNELLCGSIIELLEENITNELVEVLEKLSSGDAIGDLADNLRTRSTRLYPGQVLVSEVEAFVRANLESGQSLYVSRTPIGAFCLNNHDVTKKRPPCLEHSQEKQPNPEFCDYISCPHVLHTQESQRNIESQIKFYRQKQSYLPENCDVRIADYYASIIEKNETLLIKLRASSTLLGAQVDKDAY